MSKSKFKKFVGLDIGSHAIKIAELIIDDSGFKVVHFAVQEIPKAVLGQKDSSKAFGKLIKRILVENKIQGDTAYISVGGHNVVIRQAELPKMPENELADAVRWNAREEVLFSVEDAAADYHIMDETKKNGANYYELLSVIVRADIVPSLISIVKNAGLKPGGVTIIPIALWDYDLAVNKLKPGTITSYIDMGAARTRVYFVADERLLFSREIPNGGKNITAALIGEYDIEGGETVTVDNIRAEEIKKNYGLPQEDPQGKTQEGIPLKQIRDRILPTITKQAEEFRRSIDYFKNQYRKNKVHRMVLSGGAVSLKGLYRFLTDYLEVEIVRCNALIQSSSAVGTLSTEQVKLLGPSLTVAAGLAIGQCAKINVLPDEFRYSFKKTLVKLAPFSIFPLLLIGLLMFSLSVRGDIASKKQLLEEKQKISQALQVRAIAARVPIQDLNQLKSLKQQLEKEKNLLPRVSNPVDLGRVLDELARIIPLNTSLSRLSYISGDDGEQRETGIQKEWVLVEGIIFGNEMETLNTLTDLLEQLKSSQVFKEAKLNKSQSLDAELYTSPGLNFDISLLPIPRRESQIQEARR